MSTLPELVALSKKRPGEILYAANLRGTFPHLTVERLRKETGADLNFVPYPGAAAGLQDLMGGRISLVVESVGALYGAMQSGSIKPLAVASKERLANFLTSRPLRRRCQGLKRSAGSRYWRPPGRRTQSCVR